MFLDVDVVHLYLANQAHERYSTVHFIDTVAAPHLLLLLLNHVINVKCFLWTEPQCRSLGRRKLSSNPTYHAFRLSKAPLMASHIIMMVSANVGRFSFCAREDVDALE